MLNQYDQNNKLTWHNGTIPSNETWIKAGGDHGEGSFKTMLQVGNLPNPTQEKNRSLVSIVRCKDSPQNLRKILHQYKKQIADLPKME